MTSGGSADTGSATAGLDDALRDAAERFEPRVDEIASRLADHLAEEIPELGDEPELHAELVASNRANLSAWLGMVKRGTPAEEIRPPEEALAVARTYLLRGTPLPIVLRVYRVGHGFVYREWLAAMLEGDHPPVRLGPLVERSMELSFAYIDAMSTHIAGTSASERASSARSADLVRAETVRGILSGAEVDLDAASQRLGCELRRWHVGMVLWADPADDAEQSVGRLEAAAREVATGLGCARPVVVPIARSLAWAWSTTVERPDPDQLGEAARRHREDGVSVGLGEPGEALAGFVRSHREATAARRVSLLAARAAGSVTSYNDVDLLALLTSDVDGARRLVETQLGPLAADDDTALRLRATLRAYLGQEHSFAAAARQLGIHENTVKYRVRQCEEILGRPAGEHFLRLEAALVLADALASPE